MSRYVAYNPEQVWLLPPSVREELGENHLAVFVHELVEKLDVSPFEAGSEQGRPGYPAQLMLKVWLYAYAQGITSARRIEQRINCAGYPGRPCSLPASNGLTSSF